MKRMIYGFLLWFVALFGVMTVSPVALANVEPSTSTADDWLKSAETAWGGDFTKAWANGFWWHTDTEGGKLIDTVKRFINIMLWSLATIALVICLYAGFKMVTSSGDETKYKEGIEMMKKAGIGLVVIGLAWMIVSVVMWLIGSLTS